MKYGLLSVALLGALTLLALSGCDPQERDAAPAPQPPPTTIDDNEAPDFRAPKTPPKPRKAEPVAEEIDLIGDKPGAQAPKKTPLLEELKPQGPLCQLSRDCYRLVGDAKSNLDVVTKDLDDGGKEITRLIRTTDALAANINKLAELWPHNETFRDICGAAKRRTLLLNDELSQTPRNWAHVRWAFNSTVQDLRRLRLAARDLAEAEPKPIAVVGRDGKVTYVEPGPAPVDPAIATRERKLREVEAVREKARKYEEAKKNKPMRTELDDN